MSFNYRQNGQWQTPTVKRRENGQWVTVSSGGGGGGTEYDGFYGPEWVETPTRSNEAYVSNFSGLDDALSNVSGDTTLYLDNGPYTGSGFSIGASNVTISGAGYSNAYIEHDGSTTNCVDSSNWSTTDIGCDPPSAGDTTVTGVNASSFSVGDEALLIDDSNTYTRGNPGTSGSGDSCPKSQMIEVTAVDTGANTIDINPPAQLSFDGTTYVRRIDDWGIEDVHFDSFDMGGQGKENDPGSDARTPLLRIQGSKDLWATNLYLEEMYGYGLLVHRSRNLYVRNCESYRTRFYGFAVSSGSTNAHIHDSLAQDLARYCIQTGQGASGGVARHIRAYGCVGRGLAATYDAHFGAEDVEFRGGAYHDELEDGTTPHSGGAIYRLRGHDQHGINGEVFQASGHTAVNTAHTLQWPGVISFEGVTSDDVSTDRYGFRLRTGESTDVDYPIERVDVVNCDLHGDSNGDPFNFQGNIDTLYVSDYYWNGSLVTASDIESSLGYGDWTINYTVDNS